MFGIKSLKSQIIKLEEEVISLRNRLYHFEEEIPQILENLEELKEEQLKYSEKIIENLQRFNSMINEFKGVIAQARAKVISEFKE